MKDEPTRMARLFCKDVDQEIRNDTITNRRELVHEVCEFRHDSTTIACCWITMHEV